MTTPLSYRERAIVMAGRQAGKTNATSGVIAARLRERGFDQTRVDDGEIRLGCSQCAALAVNGVATHEMGCPNAK